MAKDKDFESLMDDMIALLGSRYHQQDEEGYIESVEHMSRQLMRGVACITEMHKGEHQQEYIDDFIYYVRKMVSWMEGKCNGEDTRG